MCSCLCSVIVLRSVGWWWKEGRRWNPMPAHSLLLSKSTKGATTLNIPIQWTNRYQEYYMPSQHTYCGRVCYPAGDRTLDLLNQRQTCYHLSQCGEQNWNINKLNIDYKQIGNGEHISVPWCNATALEWMLQTLFTSQSTTVTACRVKTEGAKTGLLSDISSPMTVTHESRTLQPLSMHILYPGANQHSL